MVKKHQPDVTSKCRSCTWYIGKLIKTIFSIIMCNDIYQKYKLKLKMKNLFFIVAILAFFVRCGSPKTENTKDVSLRADVIEGNELDLTSLVDSLKSHDNLFDSISNGGKKYFRS